MQYFGGKVRISKPLTEFLNSELKEGQTFVDLFCGSCNVVSKIDNNRKRIANDKHPYLIEMWKALQQGWIPPTHVSEEDYRRIKVDTSDKALHGFTGFGLSFAGKWWGGYCRNSRGDDYSSNAHNSVLKKLTKLMDVQFVNNDYKNVDLPEQSFVYCDIPYKGTTQYHKGLLGVFDHVEFYQWCRNKAEEGHSVYVSEYLQNVPEDCTVVWQYKSKKDIRDKDGIQQPTTEVVFTFNI